MAVTLRKAVFLDKDGTLVRNIPYNVDPTKIRLTPGAGEAVRLLVSHGYRLVVVSNQPGVALGYCSEQALKRVHQRLRLMLSDFGVFLAGFFYCPHHPDGSIPGYTMKCFCRKPMPGMLLRGATQLKIDLDASWIIGDILDDVEAGKSAGCRAVLLTNGGETEWRWSERRMPDYFADNLAEAARLITGRLRPRVLPAPGQLRKGDRR